MSHPDTQKPAGVQRASRRDTRTTIDDDSGRIERYPATVNDPRREAVLASLRRAAAHYRCWQLDVEDIGTSLRLDLITTQRAIDEMRDMGLPLLMDMFQQPGDTIGEAA